MRNIFPVLISLILWSTGYSITTTQTDWSEGSGAVEPVLQWSGSFYASSQIYAGNGFIETITLEPVKHIFAAANSPVMLDVGDVDCDGDIDVAAATESNVYLLRNMQYGQSWSREQLNLGEKVVNLIDYNEDGKLDILTTDENFKCYLNMDGTGHQWSLEIESTYQNNMTDCDAADLDGDGDNDLMGSATGYYNFSWWEEDTNGCY